MIKRFALTLISGTVLIAGTAASPLLAASPETLSLLKTSNPERVARVGQHLMAGGDDLDGMQILIEKRAVMGLFITDNNVKGKTVAQVRAKIDAYQAIRAKQGLPPLIIAADQEGGPVSRLTPPLQDRPSLATTLLPLEEQARVASLAAAQKKLLKAGKKRQAAALKLPDPPVVSNDANSGSVDTEADKQARIEAFARGQALELNGLGVNLNFAPVVDLKVPLKNRNDGETMLDRRAISADPELVTKTAGWYCSTMMSAANVGCTLKHFPGLGHITNDTHRRMATLTVNTEQLQGQDWVPYRQLMKQPGTVTMLGHVRLTAIDDKEPASASAPVIDGLIRKKWGYEGLLITDDFSMGAIMRAPGGAGAAAIKTLNAGGDIVLVSWSERHFASVLKALIDADAKGKLDQTKMAASKTRIAKTVAQLTKPMSPAP
jgi:beta-N-acetylhexosaminidase